MNRHWIYPIAEMAELSLVLSAKIFFKAVFFAVGATVSVVAWSFRSR